jgi:ribonuclease P protein component
VVLPQRHRLRGRGVFDYLYRQGRAHNRGPLLLRVVPPKPELLKPELRPKAEDFRFAVVISTKVSKRAVVRNRLRRLFHTAFTQWALQAATGTGPQLASRAHWLLLSLRPEAVQVDPHDLLREWWVLMQQAGLSNDGVPQSGPE